MIQFVLTTLNCGCTKNEKTGYVTPCRHHSNTIWHIAMDYARDVAASQTAPVVYRAPDPRYDHDTPFWD